MEVGRRVEREVFGKGGGGGRDHGEIEGKGAWGGEE